MFQRKPLTAAISSIVAAGAFGVVGAAVPSQAYGAEAEGAIEEVVVTGSRIRRPDLDAVSPVTVVDQEEFTLSGIINVENKLNELPQALPSFGATSNNPGDGTARVDLRGLGSFRTLVLVNGRRYMNATQTGVVDLNTIPASLIERVDVVTGGASAVYGSDAMAGVVNFILKDDFEGVEINALYDITEQSDGEKFNTDLTIGGNFADGRGNATVYMQYSDRQSIYQGDRSFSDVALTESGGMLVPGGSTGTAATLVFPMDPDGTANSGDEIGAFTFDQDGSARPFQDPEDRFNYAPDNFLQLPQERFLAHGQAHFDVTDHVRAYTEITFAQNEVPTELAATPAFVSTVEVNPDSAFFGPSAQAILDQLPGCQDGDITACINADGNAILGTVGRRMVENGPRQSIDNRDAYRILLGFEGDLTPDWGYNVFASHSRVDNQNLLENDVSDSAFRQALLVNDDATACQDPSGGCVPINIWGPGNISDAAIEFVNIGATNITSVQQDVVHGSVTGSFANPMNDAYRIGVVAGMEYREDQSNFRPDTFLSSGDVLGFNAGKATVGSFDVTEFFAEVDVPLVTERPGVEYLGIWGAYRYSDYSNIGGVNSYAATLTYAPVPDVRFRGGYQRATRAPNVQELFLGQANGFPPATDPCSSGGGNPSAIVDLCEATGVPAGSTGAFQQANAQIEGIFGGNPDLQEETADTYTLGVVYEPQWAEALDVTVDYYSIEIEDAIAELGGGLDNTLDICYNQLGDLSSPFCQAISRRPDGNVDVVQVLNENIGAIETEGVDLTVNYLMPLNFGIQGSDSSLSITYRSNYLLKYDETPVAGLPTVFECAGNFGNTCGDPRSEYKHSARLTWESGPLTLSTLWRFLSAVDDDRIDNADVPRSDLVVDKISAEHYFDLTGAWRFSDQIQVTAGVKNLFDELPTRVGDVQGEANSFPQIYDIIGRRYFISGRFTFGGL